MWVAWKLRRLLHHEAVLLRDLAALEGDKARAEQIGDELLRVNVLLRHEAQRVIGATRKDDRCE